jgi:hypothetical protein
VPHPTPRTTPRLRLSQALAASCSCSLELPLDEVDELQLVRRLVLPLLMPGLRVLITIRFPVIGHETPKFYLLSFVFSALMLSAAVRDVDSWKAECVRICQVSHGGCSRLPAHGSACLNGN